MHTDNIQALSNPYNDLDRCNILLRGASREIRQISYKTDELLDLLGKANRPVEWTDEYHFIHIPSIQEVRRGRMVTHIRFEGGSGIDTIASFESLRALTDLCTRPVEKARRLDFPFAKLQPGSAA